MGTQDPELLEWQNIQENAPKTIDESRLLELMQGLQQFVRLQREAASASVHARQKKREVTLKRQDAWSSDAKFMAEIQRLSAHGRFEGFEILKKLAAQCQASRDNLGLLEQEGIEAEQEWEGHIWNLRQAEEQISSNFEYEFRVAETYSAQSSDTGHSAYTSSSNMGSEAPYNVSQTHHTTSLLDEENHPTLTNLTQPPRIQLQTENESTSQLLLGLAWSDQEIQGLGDSSLDSYSGVDAIDEEIGGWRTGDLIRSPEPSQKAPPTNFELYPQLLNEFASRRDRINKWLQYTLQVSHLDGITIFSILKDILKAENKLVPSNWSQLVIAYWGLDEAASPANTKLAISPKLRINELRENYSQETSLPLDSTNLQQSLHPFELHSRQSCNTDHGYFSDTQQEKSSHSTPNFDTSRASHGFSFSAGIVSGGHKSQP